MESGNRCSENMLNHLSDIRGQNEINTINFVMDFTDAYSSTEYFVQFTQNTAFLSEDQILLSAHICPPSLHTHTHTHTHICIYIYIYIYIYMYDIFINIGDTCLKLYPVIDKDVFRVVFRTSTYTSQ